MYIAEKMLDKKIDDIIKASVDLWRQPEGDRIFYFEDRSELVIDFWGTRFFRPPK